MGSSTSTSSTTPRQAVTTTTVTRTIKDPLGVRVTADTTSEGLLAQWFGLALRFQFDYVSIKAQFALENETPIIDRTNFISATVNVKHPLCLGFFDLEEKRLVTIGQAKMNDILERMRHEVLRVGEHRNATFTLTGGDGSGDGNGTVEGTLVLRGVPIGITCSKVGKLSDPAGMVVRCPVSLKAFGIRPPSAMGGLVQVADRVDVTVELHPPPFEPEAK